MRITALRLVNFKRFTDLTILGIPATAKLVVVVGPNGCGKSTLFDAFTNWYRAKAGFGVDGDEAYFRKSPAEAFGWNESVSVWTHEDEIPQKGSLYVRTAYRNDPDFTVSSVSRPGVPSDRLRVNRLSDNDQAVSDNYQRLVYETMSGVYDDKNDTKTVLTLRDELIGQVKASMKRVFGDLTLNSISDPLGNGAFFFGKGSATSYHYKNLSGGEKAAFDLILDFHVKKKFYGDGIYCVDEVDTHLHTRVQGALVRELTSILPEKAQLWVTTHSLGVIRAAQEMQASQPGSVCLIDFAEVEPDIVQTIAPAALSRVAWEKFLSLAVDDLSPRIAPRFIVVCEGSAIGARRANFDADIYGRILGSHHPDIVFVSGGSSSQLARSGAELRGMLAAMLPSSKIHALCDRDDKSHREVLDFEAGGDLVLPKRNLEAYLLHDSVLEALLSSLSRTELLPDVLQAKSDAIAASIGRGNAPDDLKSAAGDLHNALKALLSLTQTGNDVTAFMRDTMAPLVVPGVEAYAELKAAIVDRL